MGFWEIVATVITSVGGIGAIIVFVVKLCSNIIADRLEKKYELKMNKELESYKTALSKKSYISKTRFDTEFSIYRELSVAFFNMDAKINAMIPPGVSDWHEPDKQRVIDLQCFEEAQPTVVVAQDTLYQNMPFISDTFIPLYETILNMAKTQLSVFKRHLQRTPKSNYKNIIDDKAYQRTVEIHQNLMELNKKIREYLNSLDIIE